MQNDVSKPIAPAATIVVLAALMTTTAAVPPAIAAELQQTVTKTAVNDVVPAAEAILSSAAAKAWHRIAEARGDLVDGDSAAAYRTLGEALGLLDLAEASLPTAEAKDEIQVAKAHLEYEDAQEVVSDPVDRSLQDLGKDMPVQGARDHIDRAREHLSKNEKKEAVAELDAANSALVYKEVDIPLSMTRRLVNEARNDIRESKTAAAEDALKAAEDNVVYLTVVVQEPLVEAHRSLWQAAQDYAAGSYGAARREVDRAIRYLDYATHGADEETRKAANTISDQARSVEKQITAKSAGVPSALDELWRRVKALSERSAEYFATGWQSLGAKSNLKADLIEAKLHLSYAQIDRFIALQPERAAEELGLAQNYLDQAADLASADQATRIGAVWNDVKNLAVEPVPDQQDAQYVRVLAELGHMIGAL